MPRTHLVVVAELAEFSRAVAVRQSHSGREEQSTLSSEISLPVISAASSRPFSAEGIDSHVRLVLLSLS